MSDEAVDINENAIGQLAYKGNSVSWTHSKAMRYRSDLEMAWDALRDCGIQADGKTHVADAIRKLGARMTAQPDDADDPLS